MPPSVPSEVRTRRAHPALPLARGIWGAASFWGGCCIWGGCGAAGGCLKNGESQAGAGGIAPSSPKTEQHPLLSACWLNPLGGLRTLLWLGESRSCCLQVLPTPHLGKSRSLRGFAASSHPHPPSGFGALPAVTAGLCPRVTAATRGCPQEEPGPRRRRRRFGSGRGESLRLSFSLLHSQLWGLAEDPWFLLWGGTRPQPHSGADDPDPCRVLPLPLGPCHGNPEGSLQLLGASSPGLLKRFGADIKELSCQVLRSAGRKDAAKAKPGGGGRSLILLPAPNSWGGPRSPGAWQQEKGEKPLGLGHGSGTSVFRASFVRFEANWRKKKISRQSG